MMNTEPSKEKQSDQQANPTPKKPDEVSGLLIEARFRIFDPESGETKVEGRA